MRGPCCSTSGWHRTVVSVVVEGKLGAAAEHPQYLRNKTRDGVGFDRTNICTIYSTINNALEAQTFAFVNKKKKKKEQ